MVSNNQKLDEFRKLFKTYDIKAYVLPSTDAHQNEYLNDKEFRVKFLSGFSGSNAYTIVTENKALLWTDGRYFVSAVKEFEPGWELMKQCVPESIEPTDWLGSNLNSNDKVGFDPQLFGISDGITFVKSLIDANLVPTPIKQNLVDLIWKDRPNLPSQKVIHLSEEECGKSSKNKINELRQKIEKKKCDSFLLTCLDDIAWLLNIRGFDIPYNPLVFSVLFVTKNEVHFFVDTNKLTEEVKTATLNDINIHEYNESDAFIRNYHNQHQNDTTYKVYIPDSTNYYLGTIIPEENRIVGVSFVQAMKTIKNKVELEGMRQCHIRDSAAVVQFILWLKKELLSGNKITELIAAEKMDNLRSKLDKFVSLSFTTIAAADKHAALPHYHPTELEGNVEVKKEGIFLLDSGGQYRDGTTDVTRTVTFSDKPDPYFVKMFTLVLKGHIDNALIKFPDGINGSRLDCLSRSHLWNEGYDFGHGVGHGVGHFLNVHEGPIGIGFRKIRPDGGLHAGQVITIEPGYYETDRFGIRIENCYEIIQLPKLQSGATNFLTFNSLTLVPIQRELIEIKLLEDKHINWINDYHKTCLEKVGIYFQEHNMKEEYSFLEDLCKPI